MPASLCDTAQGKAMSGKNHGVHMPALLLVSCTLKLGLGADICEVGVGSTYAMGLL